MLVYSFHTCCLHNTLCWVGHRPSFALDCFKHVVQILPASFEAWGNLGAIHGQLGNYAEAIGAMEEAAKLR